MSSAILHAALPHRILTRTAAPPSLFETAADRLVHSGRRPRASTGEPVCPRTLFPLPHLSEATPEYPLRLPMRTLSREMHAPKLRSSARRRSARVLGVHQHEDPVLCDTFTGGDA